MAKLPSNWPWLRSSILQPEILRLIEESAAKAVATITHVRTAHYAAYRVTLQDESSWLVRIGIVHPTDTLRADNTDLFGTSAFSPTGQQREVVISQGYAYAGASVIPIPEYVEIHGFDITWTPFKEGAEGPFTAGQWHETLTTLQSYKPDFELPVFTNRAKTFTRLEDFKNEEAELFRAHYDEALERLFNAATQWSVVHGDAHAGNALNVQSQLLLFDFDTVCWGPTVWDLSHLLNRAGTGLNTGYKREELASLFPFTNEEIEAAQALRHIASKVARKHNAELEKLESFDGSLIKCHL